AELDDCAICASKSLCTRARRRFISRHIHEEAFERMLARLAAAPRVMAQRRSLAEHPFAQLKCWVMGDGRFLLRGLQGSKAEMALPVLARNLRRVISILGTKATIARLAQA